jgi:hypothetical protein
MFAHLMMKKRREEAFLKAQGLTEELESISEDKDEVITVPPPNGFGGSSGDYMRAKLNQIPAEKVERMLGRYPHVLAELDSAASQ